MAISLGKPEGVAAYESKGADRPTSRFGHVGGLSPALVNRLGGAEVTGFAADTLAPALELPGKHLTFRSFRPEDFDEVLRVTRANADRLTPVGFTVAASDLNPDATAFADWVDKLEVDRALDRRYEFGGFDGDELVAGGSIWGVVRGTFESAFVAGWVAASLWAEDLGPEGLVLLSRFAFEDLELHRLEAPVLPDNQASRALMDTVGFSLEGTAPALMRVNRQWRDHLRYALAVERWRERRDDLVRTWLHD